MNTYTGEYQNRVEELPELDMKDYERIFKVFKMSLDNKDFYYYSFLNKVDFPVIDDVYLGKFKVETRMPMTLISHKIYGDIRSWWIVYLLNKDVFDGHAPFYVDGGNELYYILPEYRAAIYDDVTKSTLFNNRHYS